MHMNTARQSTKVAEFADRRGRLSAEQITTIAAICLSFLPAASALQANEVTNWNDVAGRASLGSGLAANPIFESRVYAIAQTAVHAALNAIDRRAEPYAYCGPLTPCVSAEAAVATAAHLVLVDQFSRLMAYGYSSQQEMLDGWAEVLLPEIERQHKQGRDVVFRADAALPSRGFTRRWKSER
jgi:hypothetical protein